MSPRAEGEPAEFEPISWWGGRRRNRRQRAEVDRSEGACPECHSTKHVVPIYYGEPTPEFNRKAHKGQVVLGGVRDPEGRPRRHCKQCGRDF